MRRSPITIGILAAELAMGAVIAAPAGADQPSDPPPPPSVLPPVRDGRADPVPDPVTVAPVAFDPVIPEPMLSEPVLPAPGPEVPADPAPKEPVDAPVDAPAQPPVALRTGRVGAVVDPSTALDLENGSGDGSASSFPTSAPSPGERPVPTPKVPPVASGAPRPAATSALDGSAIAAPVGATGPTGDAAGAYQVVAGDNLWEIAARHLAETSGRGRASLSTAEIAGYWVAVCAANRERLQSGNVNLIDPGEVVVLPAL